MPVDISKITAARNAERLRAQGDNLTQGLEAAKVLGPRFIADSLEALRFDIAGLAPLLSMQRPK